MTNKAGVTFIKGHWYQSNHRKFIFQYAGDRKEGLGGVLISFGYEGEKLLYKNHYVFNYEYIDKATPISYDDLRALNIIKESIIINTYSIF